MNKLLISYFSLLFFVSTGLSGFTEGTVQVADVSIKPDFKNVTYFKAKVSE